MSLELTGTITGNVRKYEAHADSTNDGKTANVTIEIDLTEKEALGFGGDLFARACFNDFVGGSAAATADSKKLGGELAIKSEHTVEIDGYSLVCKPVAEKIDLSSKERVVTVTLKLKVPGSAKKLRHQLDDAVGDDVELKFLGVTQADIEDKRHGFDGAKGNGAAEAKTEDAPASA